MSNRQDGFTLVELVITLVLTVIVVAFAAMFLSGPVRGYTDQSRRAELVDGASSALQRLTRDVRGALPNSIRLTPVGTGFALELLASTDGARYRATPPPADATRWLSFDAADDRFNAIGGFNSIAVPFSSTAFVLSVYNAGVPGADAWELANVITPPGTQIDIAVDTVAGEHSVTMTPPFRFAFPSPTQRVYLVEGPVAWICDPGTRTLNRYSGYTIATDQLDRDSDAELVGAGASATRVADDLAGCSASYSPGTAKRAALLTARIELERDGERIALSQQVHVENAP